MLKRDHTVGSVSHAANILRHLSQAARPLRLKEISGELGMHGSTCLNILRTLADEGLVQHDGGAKSYSLGFGIIAIARHLLGQDDLKQFVQPLLDTFATRNQLLVILWKRATDDLLHVVARASASTTMYIGTDIGNSMPLLTGSPGRVIAGWSGIDTETMGQRYAEVEWRGALSLTDFMSGITTMRARGWTSDVGALAGGLCGLSAPVPRNGPVLHVANAVMFSGQFSEAEQDRIGRELVGLGQTLSQILGNGS